MQVLFRQKPYNILVQAMSSGMNFISLWFFAFTLSSEQYLFFVAVQTLRILNVSIPSSYMYNQTLTANLDITKENYSSILNSFMPYNIFLVIAFLILYNQYVFTLSVNIIIILIALSSVDSMYECYKRNLQARLQHFEAFACETLRFIFSLGSLTLTVVFSWSVEYYFLCLVILQLALIWRFRKQIKINGPFNFSALRTTLKKGHLNFLTSIINYTFDNFIILYLLSRNSYDLKELTLMKSLMGAVGLFYLALDTKYLPIFAKNRMNIRDTLKTMGVDYWVMPILIILLAIACCIVATLYQTMSLYTVLFGICALIFQWLSRPFLMRVKLENSYAKLLCISIISLIFLTFAFLFLQELIDKRPGLMLFLPAFIFTIILIFALNREANDQVSG